MSVNSASSRNHEIIKDNDNAPEGMRICPELGKISIARCIREQSTLYHDAPHRIKMWDACPKCPLHRDDLTRRV